MNSEFKTYPDVIKRRCEVARLIKETGTPVSICEKSILTNRFDNLKRCMSQSWPSIQIAYSFKTNYDVARSGVFKELGAFAEVVSGREYAIAKKLGYRGPEIIFNGPFKDDASLRQAIADRASINVNDRQELQRVIDIANSRREVVPVGIRISSTLGPFGHSRFGFSLENGEAKAAVDAIDDAEFVDLVGLHSHIYGDTDDEKIYATAAARAADFARTTVRDFEKKFKFLNMGGGFPTNTPQPYSRKLWRPKNINVYVDAIVGSLRRTFGSSSALPVLVLEPGRFLVNDAIFLVSDIVHVSERGGKQVVNTNGSISMVPLTHYRPQVIRVYSRKLENRSGDDCPTVIYGATCRENDVLFDGKFPTVIPGDILVHFGVGAYNSSLSPGFIFDPPPMVML